MKIQNELILARIKGCLEDLKEFHQNTFETWQDDSLKDKEILSGEDIGDYIMGYEMERIEDACYLAGKIDAYSDVIEILTSKTIKDLARDLADVSKMSYQEYDDLKSIGMIQ